MAPSFLSPTRSFGYFAPRSGQRSVTAYRRGSAPACPKSIRGALMCFFSPVKSMRTCGWFLLVWCLFGNHLNSASADEVPNSNHPQFNFPKPLEEYHDEETSGLFQKLIGRIKADPFNPVGTVIFRGSNQPASAKCSNGTKAAAFNPSQYCRS